jgi:hypothetical protein
MNLPDGYQEMLMSLDRVIADLKDVKVRFSPPDLRLFCPVLD